MGSGMEHDELFMMIAQRSGGIGPLLDAFFSFLYRKTDFYHVMQEGENMGFAPGVAEKLVLGHFRKYQAMAAKARSTGAAATGKVASTKPAAAAHGGGSDKPTASAAPSAGEGTTSGPATSAAKPSGPPAKEGESSGARVISASQLDENAASSTHVKNAMALESTYNGGQTDKYVWEQTIADVTIAVPLPEGTRSRDILCVIGRRHLQLQLKGAETALLDDDYPCDDRNNQCIWEQVKTEQSFWNVADGKCTIYLEKERESWWKSALHGHVEIDTTKVDSVKRVEEYDGETQGAIRKIMFDQDQKRKGLPTSDELQNLEKIKEAWNADGSPFKGMPFDPSKVKLTGESLPGAGGDMPLPPMPARGAGSHAHGAQADRRGARHEGASGAEGASTSGAPTAAAPRMQEIEDE